MSTNILEQQTFALHFIDTVVDWYERFYSSYILVNASRFQQKEMYFISYSLNRLYLSEFRVEINLIFVQVFLYVLNVLVNIVDWVFIYHLYVQ